MEDEVIQRFTRAFPRYCGPLPDALIPQSPNCVHYAARYCQAALPTPVDSVAEGEYECECAHVLAWGSMM